MFKKVWILDDDPSIVEVIKIILEGEGYKVSVFSDDKIFFKNLKHDKPNVIIMDVWIGGVDGQEVAKIIKSDKSTKQVPIIMVSALSSLPKIALECQAEDYMEKPFKIDDLINIVKKHVK